MFEKGVNVHREKHALAIAKNNTLIPVTCFTDFSIAVSFVWASIGQKGTQSNLTKELNSKGKARGKEFGDARKHKW